jgi:Tol biopolymer transport system component
MIGEAAVDGKLGVFIYASNGQRIVRLDTTGGEYPDMSSDGRTVVYTKGDELWLANSDGTNPRLAYRCDASCGFANDAAFSPDGSRIAFTANDINYVGVPPHGPPAGTTIRILDLATHATTDVVSSRFPIEVDVPRWSPDGTQLVIGVDYFDPNQQETEVGSSIAVLPVVGGQIKPLVEQSLFAYNPDWNWKTGEIVFDRDNVGNSGAGYSNATLDIYGIQPDGSGKRQITSLPAGERLKMPYWTLDGRSITAVHFANGIYSEAMIDAATGSLTKISTGVGTHVQQIPG